MESVFNPYKRACTALIYYILWCIQKRCMEDDILIQISKRIKDRRRERNVTVQELATLANVSKGADLTN
jgi:hypothetical protein